MLIKNTWSHIAPENLPTSPLTLAVGLEVKVDDVGPAGDLVRQGGAAGLPHQGFPVAVSDLQVVKTTRDVVLNVKGSEFQHQHRSRTTFYFLRLLVIVRVFAGILWRTENTL